MYDPTVILVLPALILSMYAQFKVKNTFDKFSNIQNYKGLTGAEVAKQLLVASGINDVKVEHISGSLTDHYDPKNKVLRLSDAVYSSKSLSALGVAAHETGHAVQHNESYAPLVARSALVPAVNISSQIATPLILFGFLIASAGSASGSIGNLILILGIVLFSVVVLFQMVTLPVEFNASSRAIEMLKDYNILSEDEISPARKVLNAAALTYVAATTVAILNLVRFIIMASRRR